MSDLSVRRWHAFFREWRSPIVAEIAIGILASLAGNHMLDDRRLKWAKEAFLAVRYGKTHGLKAIRVTQTDPPDFEAQTRSGELQRCEVVEVLRPGRRRDQELRLERLKPAKITHDPEDNWLTAEEALAAVDKQIKEKAARGYIEAFILVVYVNVGFVKGKTAFTEGLKARARIGHPAFRSIVFL